MSLLNIPKVKVKEPSTRFDLYFAGGMNKASEVYLKSEGANRLCSQLLDRKAIEEWAASRALGHAKGKLFIDSGAFSAHTKGSEVNVDEYIEYVNRLDDQVAIFAQVDKIPGTFRKPKTKQELLEAPEISWKNYLYMRDKVKSPDKLLPIFHQGEDYKWLKLILDARFDGKPIPYIGISPANDQTTKQKELFIDKCFKIIKDSSNPDVKTHAFGMTAWDLLERYPFTSADSTTWLMSAANGAIITKYGTVVVSERCSHQPAYLGRMPKAAVQEIQKYVESHGFSIQELSSDYKQRFIFNIMFLLEWANNYEYRPTSAVRKSLF